MKKSGTNRGMQYGALVQLGEYSDRTREVVGSTPTRSTGSTTRRKEERLVKKQETFVLTAFYSASKHPLIEFDATIRGIVGRPETGAGTELGSMTRDISFEFNDEKAAKKALTRLKAKKIRAELASS